MDTTEMTEIIFSIIKLNSNNKLELPTLNSIKVTITDLGRVGITKLSSPDNFTFRRVSDNSANIKSV